MSRRSRSCFFFHGSSLLTGFVFIHVAGKETGQHGTCDLMNSSADSSRDSDSRGKVDRADGKSEGIILHADFQGNRVLLAFAKAKFSRDEIPKSKTEENKSHTESVNNKAEEPTQVKSTRSSRGSTQSTVSKTKSKSPKKSVKQRSSRSSAPTYSVRRTR